MRRALILLPLLIAAAPASQRPAADWNARFLTLSNDEYLWRLADAGQSTGEGPAAIMSPHLPDVSPAAQAVRTAKWAGVLKQLDAIPQASLTPENRVNYAVYRGQIEALLAEQQFREWEKPVNSDSPFWQVGIDAKPLRSDQEYQNYIAQMGETPRYFDQQIANMKAGEARGFTPPQATIVGRDGSIASVAEAKKAEDTGYWGPFETMPHNIPAARQEQLRAQARAVIMAKVVPAYAKLLSYWKDDYFPHANPVLAAEKLPDGKAYYTSKIREFTTLDMTPDQIHAYGLQQVASIHAEMLAVMQQTGFKGDFPAFLQYLRTDPQFYAKTPQALLDRAAWAAKMFDGKASTWFGHLPRRRFAIVPVPADIAPTYTSARGGNGIYLVNTYDLPSRPLYQLTALTLHESAPGHAFQIPLAAENKDQPRYRKEGYISAYGEGWALYCERLGDEMGMYQTPYEKFGMLSFQMWRASRLVVDTGVHHLGWTRAQAQQFLHDNTALADHDIETEVDRYISWPGQALSYYLGEMTIRNDRARAEKALGAKFNIRAFHDAMLQLGSVPMSVVDARTDQFIADGGKGPYPDEE
ncbi:DUF885 domain-containing protein [Sphingomonas abietis]|uniref:DUF885 family protein n=1 Tax=Sphingomonas abietis TaxID=3012344 RepID=A0ABY7NQL3_9SPHN|nr:DUF885 family protein [Sphingomonas abietis]WBO22229.1 DUF885 family protein [Sphingomonas abietis]